MEMADESLIFKQFFAFRGAFPLCAAP